MMRSLYGKLAVMPRSAAALSLSASSQSPIAISASIWFADEHGALDPVPAHHLEPFLPESRRLSEPSQHRQRIGEWTYARSRPM